MAVSLSSIPSPTTVFSAYASISAFIMLIQTILHQLIPRQLQQYLILIIRHYFKPKPNKTTILIEETDGLSTNEVYNAAETYLCNKMRPNIDCFKISKSIKDTNYNIKFARCEKITDSFHGADLEWRYVEKNTKNMISKLDEAVSDTEKRCFELSFDKVHKDLILDAFVPFVLGKAKALKAQEKVVKLHTLAWHHSFSWESVTLKHPSTFDTLAMEEKLKKDIVEDLDRFLRRKEFYRKVGRAWKRGYLLYGPPGTGKSSLIAAMANYLKFDIYDLELTNVRRDSDLRTLLLRTANQSILVIEDIDCSVELPDRKRPKKADNTSGDGNCTSNPRERQFTLSGLLNFIDGLWSSCGDERIIVFTTNHKEKLDHALLRPGRMDMHIHMSYLTMDGFKILASTYLNIEGDQHLLFREIEELLGVVKVTPAEAAEELMHSDDNNISLQRFVDLLKFKKNPVMDEAESDDAESDEGDEDSPDSTD